MIVDRDRVVHEVRERMEKFGGQTGLCLLWAGMVTAVLCRMGVRAIVQAGSMSWPRMPLELDDGRPETLTHFSYQWDPDSPASVAKMMRGELPEVHFWTAIPETQEIIDMTTGELPQMCKKLSGLEWTAQKPPPYFWCEIGAREWPQGVVYIPNPDACRLAVGSLLRIGDHALRLMSK